MCPAKILYQVLFYTEHLYCDHFLFIYEDDILNFAYDTIILAQEDLTVLNNLERKWNILLDLFTSKHFKAKSWQTSYFIIKKRKNAVIWKDIKIQNSFSKT